MVKKPDIVTPCNQCPFRRKSMAGWLGAGAPESFVDCINRDELLPCHPTINYEDPEWKEKWLTRQAGSACQGALIMAANMSKMPRDHSIPRVAPNKTIVFSNPMEFVSHHRGGHTQSWNEEDQSDETKYLVSAFERAARESGKPFKMSKKRKKRP